ncbi:MAG: Crp/Fnr family transcriptional regulator, partial [Acidobacteriota bacterium]|nr:Crp/Fnr family transcriptional regulator [Acidobacteriota bacterium]
MSHRRACDLSVEDRSLIIRQSDLRESLTEPLIAKFAVSSTAVDYHRRRFIYRAGEEANALYIIARGRVKFCRIETGSGREAVIDILSEGALFGESALYGDNLRQNNAVAYENSRLLRVPVEVFRGAMAENHELYDYTFRLIGQRLSRAERRVADFALDAIPARLEKLLVELSAQYGVEDGEGVLINLPLPHREIASIVGSTRESVTVRL